MSFFIGQVPTSLPPPPSTAPRNHGVHVTVETEQHTATATPASSPRSRAATVEDVTDEEDDEGYVQMYPNLDQQFASDFGQMNV